MEARHATHENSRIGRHWRQILGSIPTPVCVYDAEGKVVFANDMASDIFGYPHPLSVIHRTIDDLSERFRFYNEAGQEVKVEGLPSQRALRENQVIENTLQLVEKTGNHQRWLIAKSYPITGRKHETIFIVSAYQDITSFKEAERRLRESNQRMRDMLEEMLHLN